MKKTLSPKTKYFMRMVALMSLLQAGCGSFPLFKKNASYSVAQVANKTQINMDTLPSAERAFFSSFIKDYKSKSPSARKLLSELEAQKACLEFFDSEPDKDNLFRAGESDEDCLGLNREIRSKKVSLDNTFFHEGEHVVHLKQARSNGINARSFASLDDVFIYATLMEALAYRKAALCCGEYESSPFSFKKISQKAEDVFVERLKTDTKFTEERRNYEDYALALSSFETNVLPNQVHFKQNPDWDKIASLLSRGEVKKVPVLPRPTLTFLGKCLLYELKKHPHAKKLEEFDISCALANKSVLQQDQKAIKNMISDTLMEVYDMCPKNDHNFSRKIQYSFLYHIGWPTADQMEKIKQKKITLKEVREANLKKFKTKDLFDAAEKILTSPEVKALGIPDIQTVAKILHFEKMILIPPVSNSRTLKKQKVR